MASTWSSLKIELLETGANSGTWGTSTNVNLGDAVLGEAITGSATVDFPTDADVTVTLTDSATSQSARNLRLNITESSTGVGSVRSLILGSGCQIEKFYLINNTGTGAKTVKNTTGTGISVPAGKATLVYNNGTNVVDAATYFTSLTLGTALPVASGGTGLTAGTSGGVLAYTATGTLASSAALTQYGVVYGGGAGAVPVATAAGTTGQVLTATTSGAPSWAAPATSGTVTSVAMTVPSVLSISGSPITSSGTLALTYSGTALPVANGGTGLTAGTSGGVLAYTATGTLASSAALAASALVIGGGAGAAPSTTTTGTGVVTALGVNVGSAGAFVVNGGALGSPSTAGTMPAFTLGGTVSGGGNQINNVIIGTTTPLAGAFTTVTATGAIKQSNGTRSIETFLDANGSGITDIATTESVYLSAAAGTVGIKANGTTSGTFSSTGLAVTGTLSATQNSGGVAGAFENSDTANGYGVSIAAGGTSATRYSLVVRNPAGTQDWFKVSSETGQVGNSIFAPGAPASPVVATISTTGLAVTGTLSATGTLSGGTSGTGYSFSGSAPATSLTLDSAGNLGLGVTPSAWVSANPIKAIQVGRSGSISYDNGTASTNIVAGAYLSATGQWTKIGTTGSAKLSLTDYDGSFYWSRAASGSGNFTYTDVMTLDASGNLGIGTTSPSFRLHAVSSAAVVSRIGSSGGSGAFINFIDSGASPTVAPSVGAIGNNLVFMGDGSSSERARIDSSGNLLVGTTSTSGNAGLQFLPNANATGSGLFSVDHITGSASGHIYASFNFNGSSIGSITQSGTTAVLYNLTSDQRLKENIQDADSASALIDSIQVRKFDWITDKTHQRYGFIAQELVTVAPEAVHQPLNPDDMMAVDYSKLVPLLVKEVQSLRARVAQLESKP